MVNDIDKEMQKGKGSDKSCGKHLPCHPFFFLYHFTTEIGFNWGSGARYSVHISISISIFYVVSLN